jgi:hypothetical protein
MQKRFLFVSLMILIISALACSLPFIGSSGVMTGPATEILAAAAQTIAAQQLGATEMAINQGVELSATPFSQSAETTQTALTAGGAEATFLAQITQAAQETAISAQAATATAQLLAATVAAYDAQATANSLSRTATAQAYLPPPPPPPAAGTYISFPSGATSINVDGQIKKGERVEYLVRALKGQTMMVNVYSPNKNVYLGVVGLSDGVPLLRPIAGSTGFVDVLRLTQDYNLSLFSPDQKASYTLQVIIPARIQFGPGIISGTIPGYLQGGEINYYLVHASAGQTMTVNINSPGDDIFLTIYGMEDGSPLVRSVMAQTSWSGNLPRTQDYMLEAVSTGGNASYTIQVTIE